MNRRMKPTDERYEVLQRNYLEQLNHYRIDHLQQTLSKLQNERNKWTHQNLTRNVGRTTGFFDFILN